MDNLSTAISLLQQFKGPSLPKTVDSLETRLRGVQREALEQFLRQSLLNTDLLNAAYLIKRSAARIDEVIHTIGILLALPRLLADGERVESLSLAAASTHGGFDLVTDRRVAEFTFIQWQGADAQRQNKIFKDFFFLAEEDTPKYRELYVLGTDHVVKFLSSRRALARVIASNAKLAGPFRQYGNRFSVVRDYYETKKDAVSIIDLRPLLPAFGDGQSQHTAEDNAPISRSKDSARASKQLNRRETGMTDLGSTSLRKVSLTDDSLTVELTDGRSLSVPLAWYPRLMHGTPAERKNWRLVGRGEGVHWPDLDEDISIAGLIAGRPSSESSESLARWLKSRG